jgi:hypothetical protein
LNTRTRLLDALRALANSNARLSFRTAFLFLAKYVPGLGARRDKELAKAFDEAAKNLTDNDKAP